MPAISGNQVVYVDEGDIVMKDMSSSSVTTLTDDAFMQTATRYRRYDRRLAVGELRRQRRHVPVLHADRP